MLCLVQLHEFPKLPGRRSGLLETLRGAGSLTSIQNRWQLEAELHYRGLFLMEKKKKSLKRLLPSQISNKVLPVCGEETGSALVALNLTREKAFMRSIEKSLKAVDPLPLENHENNDFYRAWNIVNASLLGALKTSLEKKIKISFLPYIVEFWIKYVLKRDFS